MIPTPASQDDNRRLSDNLDEIVARRVEFLTQYQNAAYARRYSDFVAKARKAEGEQGERPRPGSPRPSRATCSS